MGFFDLNIPYFGNSPTHMAVLHKICAREIELGYSGIAYNCSVKGVLSDSNRCSFSVPSISSFSDLSPSMAASSRFHRDLLGIPFSSPFRQYRRLTVSIDTAAQAISLNSVSSILNTYDLVAVRPLFQEAFEQACQACEVDIISIDFSCNLPFRLKNQFVKAAVQRGVYFEISYSGLIADIASRRQIISSVKLLLDWTGGKNLIFSSGASSVNLLRGPYDVANLSYLFGMSMEHGLASISKNCRFLIEKSLRKKRYYKEAIRIEVVPLGEKSLYDELIDWDPISSMGNDLMLDDMAKLITQSVELLATKSSVDSAAGSESRTTPGLKVTDLRPVELNKAQTKQISSCNGMSTTKNPKNRNKPDQQMSRIQTPSSVISLEGPTFIDLTLDDDTPMLVDSSIVVHNDVLSCADKTIQSELCTTSQQASLARNNFEKRKQVRKKHNHILVTSDMSTESCTTEESGQNSTLELTHFSKKMFKTTSKNVSKRKRICPHLYIPFKRLVLNNGSYISKLGR